MLVLLSANMGANQGRCSTASTPAMSNSPVTCCRAWTALQSPHGSPAVHPIGAGSVARGDLYRLLGAVARIELKRKQF